MGKADRLRDRVRSYFISGPDHSRRVRQALRRLHSVDFVATATPLEAVVREQDLITQHRPPCNTVGQNPEKYVYLKAAGARGLRLFVSTSPSTRGAKLIMGPFRGRAAWLPPSNYSSAAILCADVPARREMPASTVKPGAAQNRARRSSPCGTA